MFADFGDRLEYRPSDGFSLTIEGPFAGGLDDGGNLVEKATAAYAESFGVNNGAAFRLVKQLPIAAGLGGGSADAAAALRLLTKANGAPEEISALIPLALSIGADVPCCLFSRAAIMTGIGEQLNPLPPISPIPAVLVNPMRPLPTRDVFSKLNAGPLLETKPDPPALPSLVTLDDVLAYARARGNDLETPACALLPVIREILSILATAPGARLTRLSGSGPTCFALFATPEEAQATAEQIAADHSDWWVRPVALS